MFKKISHQKTAEVIAKQIADRIEDGTLKVGDILPSERDLVKTFGVSRAGVREALRVLEAIGIVDVRPGKGCYVVDTLKNKGPLSLWTTWASIHREEILELIEIREALDGKGAYLAARNAGRIDFSGLEDIIRRMHEAVAVQPPDLDLLADLDVGFHEALSTASGNKVLAKLVHFAGDLYRKGKATFSVEGRPQESAREHEEILRAVQSGRGEEAVELVTRHVQSVKADFELLLRRQQAKE